MELVAADDFTMLQTIWTNNFLDMQGCKSNDTALLQDSQSAVLLGKNGMRSSSKQVKHLSCWCTALLPAESTLVI